MKKILLVFVTSVIWMNLFSQQINKNVVIVEIGTGTWCTYCPGAAMGADDLVENFPNSVAIIENHGGDDYQIDASSSRNSYYSANSFPTAIFNGQDRIVGGDHNNSLYSSYLPKYNSAISDLTSFNLSIDVTPLSDNEFNVTLTVDKVDSYSGTNLVAQLAITESHIEEDWQGQTELNFVNRGMFPSASGISLDFSSGSQQVINYTINVEDEWQVENCELVAFVQDNSSKEILQGAKQGLNIPIGQNNVKLKTINYPDGLSNICEDALSPIITIKNRGALNLNSLSINYEINSEGIHTYNWTGDIAFGETEDVVLDEIIYSPIASNTLDVTLSSPNGNADDDNSNNSLNVSFDKSIESSTITYLEISPGGSFSLPWEIQNSMGTVIYSGTASGSDIFTETFNLNITECYLFKITSSFGNGIPGDGYFSLKNSDNIEIFHGNGDSFTTEEKVPFKIVTETGVDSYLNAFVIYPNPVKKSFLINSKGDRKIKQIEISDITGKNIFTKSYSNISKTQINTSTFNSGIYFVNIYTSKEIITKKISVVK